MELLEGAEERPDVARGGRCDRVLPRAGAVVDRKSAGAILVGHARRESGAHGRGGGGATAVLSSPEGEARLAHGWRDGRVRTSLDDQQGGLGARVGTNRLGGGADATW